MGPGNPGPIACLVAPVAAVVATVVAMLMSIVAPVIAVVFPAAAIIPATIVFPVSVLAVMPHMRHPVRRRQHDDRTWTVRGMRPVTAAAGLDQHAETVMVAGAERNGEVRFDRDHAAVAIVAAGDGGAGGGQQGGCNQKGA